MKLETDIKRARKEIVTDGYDMSVGELANLYESAEIIINPAFQRLFRWDSTRKTKFIESLVLGIPIPPIFVYQSESGVWELIDGLQRLSTIFEFMGILRGDDGKRLPPSVLEGTKALPSLSDKVWNPPSSASKDGIGRQVQIEIKRARLRVEILKPDSDEFAKYELFQRLNTGGISLSDQEIRNCIAIMVNSQLFEWLLKLSKDKVFLDCVDLPDTAVDRQAPMELALRFAAYRNVPYAPDLDVNQYLDEAMLTIARNKKFDFAAEESAFTETFRILYNALGKKAFKRWNGNEFVGKFLISVFEVLAIGVSQRLKALTKMTDAQRKQLIVSRARDLWTNDTFINNSGAGIRGTTRLKQLLPLSASFLK